MVQPDVPASTIRVVDVHGAANVIPPTLINAYGALSIPAFWRAINFLADTLASFPRSVRVNGAAPMASDTPHPVATLLRRRPNVYQTAFIFWRTLVAHAARTGNGYAQVERDATSGRPIALHNLTPEDVAPFRYVREGESSPSQFYFIRSTKTVLLGDDVLHLQTLSHDGQTGIDPVALFDSTFQRAATLDRYQLRFLQKGSVLRGAIEIPASLTDDQLAGIRSQLNTCFRGADAEYDVIILPDGAKLSNASLSPAESQLVEQGAYATKQIAQLTGIPPEFLFEMGESKYVNNVESAGQNVVRFTLRPWLIQIEAESTGKLLSEAEQDAGWGVHLSADALLRGDTAAVNASAVTTKNAGIRTANEARELVGLPPLDDAGANALRTLGDASPTPAADSV